MENKVFFDANGITTTSANHISNLAKESYMAIEAELNNIRFCTTKISLMGSSDEKVLSKGVSDISDVPGKLKQIANLKSLIAWFREAIKEKERLVKVLNNTDDEELCVILGYELPTRPRKEAYPTIDELIDKMSIKERNRYYWLDTQCSTIGKYIHPNGYFANERKNLSDKKNNPFGLQGSGRDAILYSYIPTISVEYVDGMFFELQTQYREYQSELNSIKHTIQEQQNAEIFRIDAEYDSATKHYNAIMAEINNAIVAYRNKALRKIQSLKIAIPDALKDLYKSLSK